MAGGRSREDVASDTTRAGAGEWERERVGVGGEGEWECKGGRGDRIERGGFDAIEERM